MLFLGIESHQYVIAVKFDREILHALGSQYPANVTELGFVNQVDPVRNLQRRILTVEIGRGIELPQSEITRSRRMYLQGA